MLKILFSIIIFTLIPFLAIDVSAQGSSLPYPEDYKVIDTNTKLEPTALTVDDDFLYVIDYVYDDEGFRPGIGTQSYITMFTLEGELVRKFNHGEIKEYLYYPQDIAVNDGFIYVANTGGDNVKIFYNDGSYVGNLDRRFDKPQGITVFDNKIYVLDTTNNVAIFDIGGSYLESINVGNSFSPTGPLGQGLAVDSDYIYITDYFESRIKIFDHSGKLMTTIGEGSGEYYTTKRITRMDPNLLYPSVTVLEIPNEELSTFYNPEGLSVENGLIFVTDSMNSRIQVFNQQGEFVEYIRTKEITSMSPYSYPYSESIEVHNGVLYVGDSSFDRIQVFELEPSSDKTKPLEDSNPNQIVQNKQDGFNVEFAKQITPEGTGVVLNEPKDIMIYENQIFTIDSANEEMIQILDLEGNFVKRFGKSLDSIHGFNDNQFSIHDDSVYIEELDKILVYDTSGNFQNELSISSNNEYMSIRDMIVHDSGIYVLDGFDNQIRVFDFNGKLIDEFGGKGFETTELGMIKNMTDFVFPSAITIYRNALYVVDSGANNVKLFDLSSHHLMWVIELEPFLEKTVNQITDNNGVGSITNVIIDTGFLFMTDDLTHTVKIFGLDGKLIDEFGGYCNVLPGRGDINDNCIDPDEEGPLIKGSGQFSHPYGIATHDGLVYVSDSFNNRIQAIRPQILIVDDDPPEPKKKQSQEKASSIKNKEGEKQLAMVWIQERVFPQQESHTNEITRQPLEKKKSVSEILQEYLLAIGKKPIIFLEDLDKFSKEQNEIGKIPSPIKDQFEKDVEIIPEGQISLENTNDTQTLQTLTVIQVAVPIVIFVAVGYFFYIRKLKTRKELNI